MISLNYLNTMLLSLLGSEDLCVMWWEASNKAFGGFSPIDVDLYIVCEYLEQHCYGQ